MPESPADTLRRAEARLRGRAQAATERDRVWMTGFADVLARMIRDMDVAEAREKPPGTYVPELDVLSVRPIVVGEHIGYRHDWTAALEAARQILGEA
jgi:hypothetical protein